VFLWLTIGVVVIPLGPLLAHLHDVEELLPGRHCRDILPLLKH
jgi:hypothetical protein